jgi:hypothetical protein
MLAQLTINAFRFNDEQHVAGRVSAVPKEVRGSLQTALRYLYLDNGPVNLPAKRRKVAEPYLDDAERIIIRWLSTRTNGRLRADYGASALRAARASRYRCSECQFADVRTLNLDHVAGRVAETAFACLCANCHAIKSRKSDWTGRKRIQVLAHEPSLASETLGNRG